ncbi:MAG: hypothetical protein HJJLKODD_02585 [Phycisphaerae bacterium]|nr:hypothetical protein [Phycisphaerae bacterium]
MVTAEFQNVSSSDVKTQLPVGVSDAKKHQSALVLVMSLQVMIPM